MAPSPEHGVLYQILGYRQITRQAQSGSQESTQVYERDLLKFLLSGFTFELDAHLAAA
ncbi:MAG TPA: hypothetical protein VN682_21280 [Terriglobales bacterium]|nr:hypothetical protein [Terriglobales bacterium]